MFGYVDKNRGLLFSSYDLQQVLQEQVKLLRDEVGSMEQNQLLSTPQADLIDYLVKKFTVTPINLKFDDRYGEESEVKVDVRNDPMRWINDKSRPVLVPGQRILVKIPFEGDKDLLYCASNQRSSNPPRAQVSDTEVVLTYEMPSDAPRDILEEINGTLNNIGQHLSWQTDLISQHNLSLNQIAEQAISSRRDRLLANSSRLSALGIPIKTRENAPKTYIPPEIRKKAIPTLPAVSSKAFEPEPELGMDLYEHILSVIQNMALVMERSPSAFIKMDEEALRQHFLVQLNGQFEGKATGETFNMEGKTDILLREKEKNVFIAECKFWKGSKKFSEAIDQLLGYTSWRDSKTAILVFNRGTDMTTVLSAIKTTVLEHPNYKRELQWSHESGFRYVFSNKEDRNKELILTVLAFNVPE